MNNYSTSTSSASEDKYIYFLQSVDIGLPTIQKLYNHYGSYRSIYYAPTNEIKQLLSEKTFTRFQTLKYNKDLNEEYAKLKKKHITYITQNSQYYPDRLRHIPNPPLGLLINGRLPSQNIPTIAIIGSRGCSSYGKAQASEYAEYLSNHGIQIISGMANGIDGIAGRSALKGPTPSFAVLGSGPDICYPQTNIDLFDSLKANGGIISEYTLGSPGVSWHFPMRNRIISGLADAIVVIEAAEKSGTLITVDTALEQGRDVYALPGRTCDRLSMGCNNLIHQGAGILISPETFLAEFIDANYHKPEYEKFMKNFSMSSSRQASTTISFANPEDKLVYDCLDYTPHTLDYIAKLINEKIPMPLTNLMVKLTNMCIQGIVTSVNGTNYAKV